MIRLSIVLLLAGCAAHPAPRTVPLDLQVCPDAPAAPRVPPAPRSVKQIVQYSNALAVARDGAVEALAVCKRRVDRLNGLMEQEHAE